MECRVILFYASVISYLNLVASYPNDYMNKNPLMGWSNIQRAPQPPRSVISYPNYLPYSIPNIPRAASNFPLEVWARRNQVLQHQNQLNFANSQKNILPLNYYPHQGIPGQDLPLPYNNLPPAKPQVINSDLRGFEGIRSNQVRPNDRNIAQTGHNVQPEGWWNGVKFMSQYNNFVMPKNDINELPKEILPSDPRPNNIKTVQNNVDSPFKIGYDTQPREWWNGLSLPQQYTNIAREPQNYEKVPPIADDVNLPKNNPISSASTTDNDLPAERSLRIDQRLPEQEPSELFERPYPFVADYTEAYENIQELNGNYPQGYSQFQIPAPIISNQFENFPNYVQRWPTTAQYQDEPTTAPVEYQPWLDYSNLLPINPLYEYNVNSEYDKAIYPNNPLVEQNLTTQEDPVPFPTDSVNQKNHTQIIPSYYTVDEGLNPYFKRSVIDKANDTNQQSNNLLINIKVDKFNIPHATKDGVQNIPYISEVEYTIPEKEAKNNIQLPFDTGISQFTQDTLWDTNYQDNFPIPSYYKNPFISLSQLYDSIQNTQMSTEDLDIINYFRPEYILPIQPVLKSNNSTNTTEIPTDNNGLITAAIVEANTHIVPQIFDIPEVLQSSNNDVKIKEIVMDPYYGYVPSFYLEGKGEATTGGYDTTQGLQKDNPEETTCDSDDFPVTQLPEEPAPGSSTTHKPTKLNDDLEVDASELKTVHKPFVWFRPDDEFWEKVTQRENSFDVLSIYDVQCKTKLIEREKTVHHYQNGTEIIEYVETSWDRISDKLPKEVKTNRYVKNPDDA